MLPLRFAASFVLACGVFATVAREASADFVIGFRELYIGTSPSDVGDEPFLTATFATVAPGQVRLTLENLMVGSTEYIQRVVFNVDPSIASGISLVHNSGVSAGSTLFSENGFFGDTFQKSGYYDIRLTFPTRTNTLSTSSGSDVSVYDIFGPAGLTEDSFDWLSADIRALNGINSAMAVVGGIAPGNGHGTLIGVEEVQIVAQNPVPSSIVLLAAGILPVMGYVRMRRQRKA